MRRRRPKRKRLLPKPEGFTHRKAFLRTAQLLRIGYGVLSIRATFAVSIHLAEAAAKIKKPAMHILVTEDDARVAELLKRGLEEEGYTVSSAYDGIMGQKLAEQHPYDLVITDIVLPGQDGVALCKALRKRKPDLPVIMLTALGTTDDKVEGLDAGADDYLVKPFEMRELMARIRAVLKRRKKMQPPAEHLRYADLEVNVKSMEASRAGQSVALTPKEFKLLEFLMRHPERVLSREEISREVWDMDFDTGTNFIDVYINYLRKKVDKGFGQKLIHTKPGIGFILKTEK